MNTEQHIKDLLENGYKRTGRIQVFEKELTSEIVRFEFVIEAGDQGFTYQANMNKRWLDSQVDNPIAFAMMLDNCARALEKAIQEP